MEQKTQKAKVIILSLLTTCLLIVVVNFSIDFYWQLCEQGALGLRLPVSLFLSEALRCSTENDGNAQHHLEQIYNLVNEIDKAVASKIKSSGNEEIPDTDSDIDRARVILACLHDTQKMTQDSDTFTGLPPLLDTGKGDRISLLLLYLFLLDEIDVEFRLYRQGRAVSVYVDDQLLDISSPSESGDRETSDKKEESRVSSSPKAGSERGLEISSMFLLAQYHTALSFIDIRCGQYRKAIQHCLRATSLAPDYSTPYLNMGLAFGKLGNYSQATHWFEKAIDLEPTRASAYIKYGNCLFKAGEVEKAGECWRKGRNLASRSGESNSGNWTSIANNNLSILDREMDFIPMEKKVFAASFVSSRKRVLDIRRIEREIRKSIVLTSMDKYKLAQELFTWIWDHYDFEEYENSHSILDVLDRKRGNCATVTTLLALLFKRFGIDVNVVFFGNHVFLSFNYERRRVDIETTCPEGFDTDMHKERPNLRIKGLEILPALLYHNRANDFNKAGNRKMVEYCLNKAIEGFPESSLSYSVLADNAIKDGELEKGLDYLKKSVEFDSFCSSTLAKLGIMLFWLERPEDGARAFHRALYCVRYEPEPDKITDKIVSTVAVLIKKSDLSENARLLEDVIYLPPGVKDPERFKQYVDEKNICAMYRIDFNGDREAYLVTSLGDLVEAETIMLYDEKNETFHEANRGHDGQYYYATGNRRVVIDTGSIFYVPLEEMPFKL